MEHPGNVDRDLELGEDLQLHAASGEREKRERRHEIRVSSGRGIMLAVVRRVVVLHRERELADLLPPDLEIVRCAVVAADESLGLLGKCHAALLSALIRLSGAAYQRDWRRDANAANAPPAAPKARAEGTPMRAALRAVRKSRISHPRSRARARRRASGLMATAVPTSDSMGTSL